MSKRVKIKEMKKMMGGGADGINGMFESMMGLSGAEPEIIRPKLVEGRNLLRHAYRVFAVFTSSDIRKDFPFVSQGMDDIKDFMDKMAESVVIENIGDKDAKESEAMYHKFDKETLNGIYRKFKENDFVKQLIVQCGRMKQWSKCFVNKEELKDNFIGQEPGLSFHIFNFSTLDLKQIWADRKLKPFVKNYILTVIHTIYTDLFKLYQVVTSPDVDIEQFATVLLSSISQLKKQPGLDRCDSAFRRIEQSVKLLKGNFGTYYRDSVSAANPNMIVESFIVDVSNQGGANPRLTREFRKIIQYMHKVSNKSGKSKDPQIQKLFSMLNKNFEVMEQHEPKPKETKETKETEDEAAAEAVVDAEETLPAPIDLTGAEFDNEAPAKRKKRRKRKKKNNKK